MDFSQKSLLLETYDAVIKHLIKGLEGRQPQLSNLSGVHAMWAAVSFVVATPTMP